MKKTKVFSLTTLAMLCLQAFQPLFAQVFEVDGITYSFNDGEDGSTLSVVNKGVYYYDKPTKGEYSGSVVIPQTVNYNSKTYTVTSIDKQAFFYCFELTSITIPSSIVYIGHDAFKHTVFREPITTMNNTKQRNKSI